MLCDDLCAAAPKEPAVALSLANVARRVATARRYLLSSEMIARCAAAGAEQGDEIIAALRALTAEQAQPTLWIEWSEHQQRVGALIEAVDPARRMWSVTLASVGKSDKIAVAPLGFMADLTDAPPSGGVGLQQRIFPAPSPHMAPFAQSLIDQGGMERLVQALGPFAQVLVAQAPFLLAALRTAQTLDGATAATVEISDKLNKARRKAGKPALLPYQRLEVA